MVQNKPKAGRPPAFDRDMVLDAAMNLFWEHGYLGVGLADLEAHTGLNRSSLYNSFGSKEALFTLALNRYTEQLARQMLATLESGSSGLADIESFLKRLAMHLGTQAGRGCFMVNTMAGSPGFTPNDPELVSNYIEAFLKTVRTALRRAVQRGEIAADAVESSADILLATVLAANLLARASQPQQRIDALFNAALLHLRQSTPPRSTA